MAESVEIFSTALKSTECLYFVKTCYTLRKITFCLQLNKLGLNKLTPSNEIERKWKQ